MFELRGVTSSTLPTPALALTLALAFDRTPTGRPPATLHLAPPPPSPRPSLTPTLPTHQSPTQLQTLEQQLDSYPTAMEQVKEVAEIPRRFVKEGTQVGQGQAREQGRASYTSK